MKESFPSNDLLNNLNGNDIESAPMSYYGDNPKKLELDALHGSPWVVYLLTNKLSEY